MNKKIIVTVLAIVLLTGSIYQVNIKTEAASITAGGYTAAKVFVALLAAAGVVIGSDKVEKIWNNGELDYSALLSNMETYSHGLGAAVTSILSSGAAGITRLKMARDTWDLFKAWARGYFGTNTTTSKKIAVINNEFKPVKAGTTMTFSYKARSSYCSDSFRFDTFDVIVFKYARTFNGRTYNYSFFVVPVTPVDQSHTTQFRNDLKKLNAINSYCVGPNLKKEEFDSMIGYQMEFLFGTIEQGISFQPEDFQTNFPVYDLGSYDVHAFDYYNPTKAFYDRKNNIIGEIRHKGQLVIPENVNATPTKTADGVAATVIGKTLVNDGNVAEKDENGEIVITGDLVLNLPLVDELADVLTRLGNATATYEEYVATLGAAVADTKTMTPEQVKEVAESIPATVTTPTGAYTVSLDKFFPFCIPFDMYNLVSAFKAAPVTPTFNVHVPIGYDGHNFTWGDYTVSLEAFDGAAAVLRVMEYILFVIGLMLISRKLIGG